MKKALILGSLMFLTPVMAFAQTSGFNNVEGTLRNFLNLINDTLLPIVIALALLYFFWGLAKFILSSGGDEEERTKGKNIMLWGIIAFFVMVSVWGIVNFFGDAFDLDTRAPETPKVRR